MLFGTYMGVFWILKFSCFPLGMSHPFLSLLFLAFTVCVPFMGYRYARLYRDGVCGGGISLPHAYLFTLSMYIFAALLASVGHYIYFGYIDGGFILNSCRLQLDQMAQSGLPGIEPVIDEYRASLAMAESLTPVDITLSLLSANIFIGCLLGLPTALAVARRRPASDSTHQ